MHAKSDSDVTSLAPSSPTRPVYYVQSPSRDSHDGDKSSSMQATPVYNSPMESPAHPSSFGRHSRASSASRFSGTFRSSSGGKHERGHKVRNDKGWPECNVIQEEGSYDDLEGRDGLSRRCQMMAGVMGFVLLFSVFCLIIWGASRPYKPEVIVKSLAVNNFYFGEGSDNTGVATQMLTANCTLKISVYNPATFFGVHVSSTPITLIYSEIPIATGQLKKYFQPKKSFRNVTVTLVGNKVPLYGAGASLAVSNSGSGVPLTLEFGLKSRAYVVGKLVKTKHKRQVSCPLVIDSDVTKPIKFSKDACTYE